MNLDYIIVQAGGRGSRLGHLTRNKPKALLPVRNTPMLFHLFRKFPEKRFIVIGDYKIDVLRKYIAAFAEASCTIVDSAGKSGTCAGISDALAYVPKAEPFMLTWCDLILPEDYEIPEERGNYIGVSRGFRCRWKWDNGIFSEEPSENRGVAGHFIFADKAILSGVPDSGEFVRYLSLKEISFRELPLAGTREFGLLSEYEKLNVEKCRPFNRMTVTDDKIIKEGIDEQGKALVAHEKAWYAKVADMNFIGIPRIYAMNPLTMEKIDGRNIYECSNLSFEEKRESLVRIIECLHSVHSLELVSSDRASFHEAYIGKTKERLEKVRNLIPFAGDEYVTVNGRKCRNVFSHWAELEGIADSYFPKEFKLIHGDCTFSNIMLRADGSPVLIDPRGYFGTTELYGDPAYDWAKLYYSIVGNYDQFNLGRFRLDIQEDNVGLEIESNRWENMEETFFGLLSGEADRRQIKALHAIIWLSLTTYAWHDYDKVCGAFYNGLWHLEEVL